MEVKTTPLPPYKSLIIIPRVEAGQQLEQGEADIRGCMEAFLVAILLPGGFSRYIYILHCRNICFKLIEKVVFSPVFIQSMTKQLSMPYNFLLRSLCFYFLVSHIMAKDMHSV